MRVNLLLLSTVVLAVLYSQFSTNFDTFFLAIHSALTGSRDRATLEPTYLSARNPASSLSARSCLVTGSSRGLGRAIVIELLSLGCNVIMGQRGESQKDEANAVREIAANSVEEIHRKRVGTPRIVPLELSSSQSVRNFVQAIASQQQQVDLVVINAAVVPSGLQLTKDCFEEGFRVNYLGHFDLINSLLSAGVAVSGKTHFLIVTSEAHKMADPLDSSTIDDVSEFGISGAMKRYAHSKLCLTTLGFELSRRGANRVSLYDPGPVNTDISRNAPSWLLPVVKKGMELFFKSAKESALPVAHLALSEPTSPPTYFVFWSNSTVREDAASVSAGSMLWSESERLIRTISSHCETINNKK